MPSADDLKNFQAGAGESASIPVRSFPKFSEIFTARGDKHAAELAAIDEAFEEFRKSMSVSFGTAIASGSSSSTAGGGTGSSGTGTPGPAGPPGYPAGPVVTLDYGGSASVPSSRSFTVDSTSPDLVTEIRLSKTDVQGVVVAGLIEDIRPGYRILMTRQGTPLVWVLYEVVALVDSTDYTSLTVTQVDQLFDITSITPGRWAFVILARDPSGFSDADQVGNSAGVEDTLLSAQLGAGWVRNGEKFSITVAGTFGATVSTDKRVRLKIGGTTVFDTGDLTGYESASWVINATLLRVDDSTQIVSASMALIGDAVTTLSVDLDSTDTTVAVTGVGTNANDVVSEFLAGSLAR